MVIITSLNAAALSTPIPSLHLYHLENSSMLAYIQPHFPSPKCTLFHSIYLGTSHRVLSPTHCLFTFLHQLLFPTYYIHPVDFPHILIHLPIISSSYLATHSYPSINIPRPSISHILYILQSATSTINYFPSICICLYLSPFPTSYTSRYHSSLLLIVILSIPFPHIIFFNLLLSFPCALLLKFSTLNYFCLLIISSFFLSFGKPSSGFLDLLPLPFSSIHLPPINHIPSSTIRQD